MKHIVPILNLDRFLPGSNGSGFYADKFTAFVRQNQVVKLPHRHTYYLVALFTRGDGRYEIDFNSYRIKAGSIFFLSPGQAHHWKLTRQADGYIFLHTRDFYDLAYASKKITDFPFFHTSYGSPVLYLHPSEAGKIEYLIREMAGEFQSAHSWKFELIHACLERAYIELRRIYVTRKHAPVYKAPVYLIRLRELETFIENHFRSIKSPSRYAEMMHISTKHLNRLCMTSLNKTTSDLIAERIILEAQRMLVYGHSNIAEIALQLGFVDTAYFSRYYKKKCGESPAEFMKRYH
jgi:AraC family transcriptional activator of pobA